MAQNIISAFRFYDKHETGLIDVALLKSVVKTIDAQVYADCENLQVFGAGAGVIDYVTFTSWATGQDDHNNFFYTPEELEAALDLEMEIDKADEMFHQAKLKFIEIDKNQSGTLDWDEVKSLAEWMMDTFGRRFKDPQEKAWAIKQQVDRLKKVVPKDSGWSFEDFEAFYRKLVEDTQKFLASRNEQYSQGKLHTDAAKKFKELDTDGTNYLEGAEVEEFARWIYSQFHPESKGMTDEETKKQAKKIVERLDAKGGDNDGRISFAEFDQYFEEKLQQVEDFRRQFADKKAKKHKYDQLKKANAKLEADKKKAEPKAPLHREQRLREIFKLCDGDKNGYLTVKEYRKLMAKSSSQNIDIAVAVFTMIDEAGKKDGKLGPEEFVTYNLKGGAGMSDELFKQQTDLWLELAKAKGP